MERLRDLRNEKELTLKDLSLKLKENYIWLSPDVLSKYERGIRKPKIENLEKLANFFNVPPEYLRGSGISKRFFLDCLVELFETNKKLRIELLKETERYEEYIKSDFKKFMDTVDNFLESNEKERVNYVKTFLIWNKNTVDKDDFEYINSFFKPSIRTYLDENIEACSDYYFLSSLSYDDIRNLELNNDYVLEIVKQYKQGKQSNSTTLEIINIYQNILENKGLLNEDISKTIKDIKILLIETETNKKGTKDIKEQAFKALGMLEDYKDLTNKDK